MSAHITTKRKLDTLAEMFPALDFVILQSVLDSQKGDLDEAIVTLLQMNETTLSAEGEEVERGVPAQPSRPTLQNYYPLGTTGKQRRRRNSNNNGHNNNLNLHPNSNSRKEKRKREHHHNPVAAGGSLLDSATASAGRDPSPVLQPQPEDLNDSFPALRLDDSVDFPRLVSPPATAEQQPTTAASSYGSSISSSGSSLSSAEAMPAPPVLSWRDVLKDMAESPVEHAQQEAERDEEQSDRIPFNDLSLSEEDRAVVPFSSSSCDDAEGTDDFVMLYEAKNVEEEQLEEEDKQEEEQEKEKEKQPVEEPEPAKEQEVVLPLHPSLTTSYNKEEEEEAEEVAVKLCYENPNKQSNDIHRFRLVNHKKDGWPQLLAHIHNKHPNCQSEFVVQYVDDEEDLITVRSQEELEEAVRVARALSLSLPGGSGGAALVAPFLLRLSVSFCS
ncbi:hypothetical protein QOT17_022001 [Balamuthia mandrillaris]